MPEVDTRLRMNKENGGVMCGTEVHMMTCLKDTWNPGGRGAAANQRGEMTSAIWDMLRCRILRNKQAEMSSRQLDTAGIELGWETWEPLARPYLNTGRACHGSRGGMQEEVGCRKA